jgi:hypothetical protein
MKQRPSRKPTVRQVYALAVELCERSGEDFPVTREAASDLIERLRLENGHRAPRLVDTPPRARGRGSKRFAQLVAAELARELR